MSLLSGNIYDNCSVDICLLNYAVKYPSSLANVDLCLVVLKLKPKLSTIISN